MIEAGLVLDKKGYPLFHHAPNGRDGGSLPDSRLLWDVFWANRNDISGFAHSHPGSGIPSPSRTDITTFAAVEAGLGIRLDWWIANADTIVLVQWIPASSLGPGTYGYSKIDTEAFPWVIPLRQLSRIGE